LIREGYYPNQLNPEYNTAKKPGAPMYGRNHSDKTNQIMSESKKGENNSNYGQKVEGSGSPAKVIEVFDLEEKTRCAFSQQSFYYSIHEAARALNISHSIIVKYFARNQQKPYKGRYTFKIL
jgi:hypothetical protein